MSRRGCLDLTVHKSSLDSLRTVFVCSKILSSVQRAILEFACPSVRSWKRVPKRKTKLETMKKNPANSFIMQQSGSNYSVRSQPPTLRPMPRSPQS